MAMAFQDLPDPRPGEPVSAEWGRAVARAIRSLRLSGGPGARVSATPSGTTVSFAGARGGASLHEILRATLPRITGARTTAKAAPLLGGAERDIEIWALDLADEDGPEGRYDVVAFPVARMVAEGS